MFLAFVGTDVLRVDGFYFVESLLVLEVHIPLRNVDDRGEFASVIELVRAIAQLAKLFVLSVQIFSRCRGLLRSVSDIFMQFLELHEWVLFWAIGVGDELHANEVVVDLSVDVDELILEGKIIINERLLLKKRESIEAEWPFRYKIEPNGCRVFFLSAQKNKPCEICLIKQINIYIDRFCLDEVSVELLTLLVFKRKLRKGRK